MLATPPACPKCARTNLRLIGRLKDRAPFRGVASLYLYGCRCGAKFTHAILNVACERGSKRRSQSSDAA